MNIYYILETFDPLSSLLSAILDLAILHITPEIVY